MHHEPWDPPEHDVIALLVWGIPRKLKLAFKALCIEQDKTLKMGLIEAMENYIRDTTKT